LYRTEKGTRSKPGFEVVVKAPVNCLGRLEGNQVSLEGGGAGGGTRSGE